MLVDEKPPAGRWLAPLLVFLVAAGLYGNTLYNGFTWDDQWLIVNNARLDKPGYLHYLVFEQPELWRTLKRASLVVDAAVWGKENSGGFHATNVAIHSAACLLLYALGRRLGLGRGGALAAAVLFAAHPSHVEAVANVSHRKEPMALFFCLGALLAWRAARASTVPWAPISALIYRATGTLRPSLTRLELVAWAGLFYLAAMLSKEVAAVMLPLVAIAHDIVLRQEQPGRVDRRDLWRSAVVATLLVASILALFTVRGYLGRLHTRYTPENIAWMTLDKTSAVAVVPPLVVKAYGFYAGLLLWPRPLYVDRAFALPNGFLDRGVLLGGLALVVMTVAVVTLRRRSPVASFGILFFAVMLLPLTNIVPLTFWLVAERFVYLPSAGIALACGAAFDRCRAVRPQLASAVLALLTLVLGATTVRQNGVWHDDRTLWENTLLHNPDSWMANHGMANFQVADGLAAEAEKSYRRSIELNPQYADPQYGLARLLLTGGRYEEAISHARVHADAAIDNPDSLVIIGNAHFSQNHFSEALAAYEEATLRVGERDDPALRVNHANTLYFLDRSKEALTRLGDVEQEGDMFQAVVLRGVLLQKAGRNAEALASYRRADQMQPGTPALQRQMKLLEGRP